MSHYRLRIIEDSVVSATVRQEFDSDKICVVTVADLEYTSLASDHVLPPNTQQIFILQVM